MIYVGYILLIIGVIFLFLGALGIFRMPDVYSRMQAGTKATTLGAMAFITGVGFLQPEWMGKALLIVAFIAISNPISSHALARAVHGTGVFPVDKEGKEVINQYREDQEESNEASSSEENVQGEAL